MKLLPLRTNLHRPEPGLVPASVYTVGTEWQQPVTRLRGFSAKQLFLTFSGTGVFRKFQHHKWDIVEPNTLLYIPSWMPHEYLPQGTEPWCVGYVTFVEGKEAPLERWGFGSEPFLLELRDTGRLFALLEEVWRASGPDFDLWRTTELLFAFCVELKKQSTARRPPAEAVPVATYRTSIVDSAVRFMQDHLQRDFSMAELAAHVGYSSRQLARIFRSAFGMTPLQYLHRLRLRTAAMLLVEQPDMTVRQVAAHVGMEPVYFTRLFRRAFGAVPSEYRNRQREFPL